MSKIEVNTIDTQCGSALQIGDGNTATIGLGKSGDTITIPCGATIVNSGTQTGFGRTGTVDWVTTPKVTGDSPITAATGSGYFLNTTAGTITINLPAGAAGSIVSMADYAATWQTNSVTVNANGSEKIGGIASPATLTTEGQSVTFVYVDSTQGWVNTMDSTSNVRGSPFIVASGGTPSQCGDYEIKTFTGPGTFCVTAAAICAANNLVSYMVVAGGGSGGQYGAGGGGGAGGFRELVSPTAPYTASPLDGYPSAPNRITVSATGYPITVGAGGVGQTTASTRGNNGSASIFSTTTSAGGGGGGSYTGSCTGENTGNTGGSGGGSGDNNSAGTYPGGAGNTPPTTPAQGTAGGQAQFVSGIWRAGGGGGGATVAGGAGTNSPVPSGNSGDGGAGATTSISATPTAYAGGGGGGYHGDACSEGAGGAGGGGAGNLSPGVDATAGTVNTGGGGGSSAGTCVACGSSGAGGSGIVIIRYKFQ